MFFKTQTRTADDRLVFAVRVSSISDMMDAIDVLRARAIWCRASMNSFSSERLVWWPDKDTDIFFIF